MGLLLLLVCQCNKKQPTTVVAENKQQIATSPIVNDRLALPDDHFKNEDYDDFDWSSLKSLKEKEIRLYDFEKFGDTIYYVETDKGKEISGRYYLLKTLVKNENGEVKLLAYMSESGLNVYLATYDPQQKIIDFLTVYTANDNANGPTDYFQTKIRKNIITRQIEKYELASDSSTFAEDLFYIDTTFHFKKIK